MDGHDSPQDRSGHLRGASKNPGKPPGSVPDGQPGSGHTDAHGDVNASRETGSDQHPVQNERGYTKNAKDTRSTKRANDGVRAPFKRTS